MSLYAPPPQPLEIEIGHGDAHFRREVLRFNDAYVLNDPLTVTIQASPPIFRGFAIGTVFDITALKHGDKSGNEEFRSMRLDSISLMRINQEMMETAFFTQMSPEPEQ